MIEIRAEANEIENKHKIQSIYEAKDWFFKKKKPNKINKHLMKPIKRVTAHKTNIRKRGH